MTFLIPLSIIALLLLVNAIFVAAEFALIGVPRATVERRAAAGHRVAKLLARILNTPRLQDQYIATATDIRSQASGSACTENISWRSGSPVSSQVSA